MGLEVRISKTEHTKGVVFRRESVETGSGYAVNTDRWRFSASVTLGDKIFGREDPLGTLELEAASREHEHHRRLVIKLRGIPKGVRFSGEGKEKKN